MGSTGTISELLSEETTRSFIGRRSELGLLTSTLGASTPDFVVAFVHGPGGIGKSSLLAALASEAAPGVRAVRLDCRDIEPTPRGLLGAVSGALGGPIEGQSVSEVAAALADGPRRTVLILDTYELFGLLDTWLRQVFIPALPVSVVTVIAGRDRPSAGWAGPGWTRLVKELQLSPLGQADAIAMLRSRGLSEVQSARANGFARGHPLALELVAAALRADPDLHVESGPPPVVIQQLLDQVLAGLPGETLETLEAASTSRRVTAPLLRALLDREDVREAFDALRRLPFVERTSEGLVIHDVVRVAIARDHAQRDSHAHERYRRRAWRFFAEEARHPRAIDRMWQVTANLIYLIRNPVLRDACFPEGATEHHVERSVATDTTAIVDIVRTHEPGPAADLLVRWLQSQPEAFHVARSADGDVAAILHLSEFDSLPAELVAADPIAAVWLDHLHRVPPREGDRVLAMRRWLGRESGEMLSAPVGACWLDVKRVYMELRPRLSRLYSVTGDHASLAPIFDPLGFAAIGPPVPVGETTYQPVWLDFGEGSVDGWLSRLVDAELDAAESAVPGPDDLASLGGLTRREAEVLALVAEGLSNRQIAARLVISDKTAGHHIANIFAKLGVHNRAQATRVATEHVRGKD